jgi:hypothetical protein
MTVGTEGTAIPTGSLMGRNGEQIEKATGRIVGQTCNFGYLGILSPSAAAGMLLKVDDVIVLEGAENVEKALFAQAGGAGTIAFVLEG